MAVVRGLNRRLLLIAGIAYIAVLYFIFRGGDPKEQLPENGASFLSKVVKVSGGKENYENIQHISFKKAFHLYAEDGTVEIDQNELHTYDFTSGTSRQIQWQEGSVLYNLIEKDTSLFQTSNKLRDSSFSRAQLENKLNAATFVLGLPYTLADDNSKKTYNGIQDFEGTPAHELEVAFKNSTDVWKMYYNQESLDWLGYWVKTSDHYSLVVNEEITKVNGFTFSRKRKSYRTDAQRNRLYLRADYLYSDFHVD